MDITKFLYLLFFCSALFLMYTKENKVVIIEKKEKPLVEFDNSVIYDISTTGVNQVIQSQKAYMYKNSEQLENATILIKSKKDINKANTISAEQIVKVKDELYLNNNVVLQSEDKMTIKTEELQYNTKTLIGTNSSTFNVEKDDNNFKGVGLYLDGKNNHVKATKIHFRINLKENNETNKNM